MFKLALFSSLFFSILHLIIFKLKVDNNKLKDISKWLNTLAATVVGWLVINVNLGYFWIEDQKYLFWFTVITLGFFILSICLGVFYYVSSESKTNNYNRSELKFLFEKRNKASPWFIMQASLFLFGCCFVIVGPVSNEEAAQQWKHDITIKEPKFDEISINANDIESLRKLSIRISEADISKLEKINFNIPKSINIIGEDIPRVQRGQTR